MVRINYKWNISKEEGEELINGKIKEILYDKGTMEISELIFFLQTRTKDIIFENNHKKKNIINFIRNVFGGLRNFLESNNYYQITPKGNQIIVSLKIDEGISMNDPLNGWILID
jgi:hypothetical protein|tara:strand:- start:138 stop:479 length:342 start_codon:yes stop_codon:yes gene_type:complete